MISFFTTNLILLFFCSNIFHSDFTIFSFFAFYRKFSLQLPTPTKHTPTIQLYVALWLSLFLSIPSILFSHPPFTQFYYLYNVLLWVLFLISSQGYIMPKIESLLCHNKRRKKTDSLYFTLTTNISGPCRRSTTLVTLTLLYAMCVVR